MPEPELVLDADTQRQYRSTLGGFATGVAIVTVPDGDHAVGLTINSFTSVSLDPPLVLWCLGEKSDRGVFFRPSPNFVLNILGAGQQALADRCAKRGQYRFEADELDHVRPGRPALPGCIARLWCDTHEQVLLGDHVAIIGRVRAFDSSPGDGLTYFRGRYGVAPAPVDAG
jgi:flavin reductase (DIM6/NTAB) family NADH-FMN oxidoreductase RutF